MLTAGGYGMLWACRCRTLNFDYNVQSVLYQTDTRRRSLSQQKGVSQLQAFEAKAVGAATYWLLPYSYLA